MTIQSARRDDLPDRTLVVDTRRTASLFGDPRRRRILLSFVGKDRCLSEVAALIDMPLNLLHYHVDRLLGAGLLRRRGKRARAGRPVQSYGAAADAFFVPAALMPGKPDERLHRELRHAVEWAEQRGDLSGFVFSKGSGGGAQMRKIEDSESVAHEFWRVVKLDRAGARKLADEMKALINAYQDSAGPRARSYLVHGALAPRLKRA